MASRFVIAVALVAGLWAARTAPAQSITVQQPVVEHFSVGTTVSVPDRGSALLGSISRAGDFSRTFGPLRLGGRSRSLFRDHSGVTAHVWIHDLAEMDRLLLNQSTAGGRSPAEPVLSGYAGHAWSSLLARSRYGRVPSMVRLKTPQEQAEKFYRLGLKASQRGAVGVARLHFQMAVTHGSKLAASKLADLDEQPLVKRTASRR